MILFITATCAFGQTKDLSEQDGSFWQQQSQTFKVGYVEGYIDAMDAAQINTAVMCAFQLKLASDSDGGKACISNAQALNFANIKVGQFVEGMDAFYKHFRNTQYPIHAAMRLVRDQIIGRPVEDIDKEMTEWRQCRADSSKCGVSAGAKDASPAPTKATE